MSSESSSASVRDGLASLKQVIVTPLPIFDDIYDLVDFFEGTSPDHIAKGLVDWYERLKTDPHALMKTHMKRISRIKERRFSLLTQKLSSMINSLEINQ